MHSEEKEPVRKNTSESINRQIDKDTESRLKSLSLKPQEEINKRIVELEREWDIERALEVNAATIALGGILLGAFFNKKWLILPGVVTAFLVQHAIQGWCPPLPVLRSLGIRTKKEIEKERIALKALRGDFNSIAYKRDKSKRADKIIEVLNGDK